MTTEQIKLKIFELQADLEARPDRHKVTEMRIKLLEMALEKCKPDKEVENIKAALF